MMTSTDNRICRAIASILHAHGVRDVVMSPGTRNAPLITAFRAGGRFQTQSVVDERSAAFVALGICSVVKRPVALVCTSGTALYNYAPALAEAYYRKLPLIAISADRPAEWIGQNDSQTLQQAGALHEIVKQSYNIGVDSRQGDGWYAERQINAAVLAAKTAPHGPVHINVQLAEPLNGLVEVEENDENADAEHFMVVREITPEAMFSVARMRELSIALASPRKVMIVVGFMSPDAVMRKAITKLAKMPNVVVLCENISNLGGVDGVVGNIDATLSSIQPSELDDFCPDVVVSVGGALVTRQLKAFLRSHKARECWSIGYERGLVDCFQQLTMQITADAPLFMRGLASAMQIHCQPSAYRDIWLAKSRQAKRVTTQFVESAPWCDLKLFATLLRSLPATWNLEYSNGTAIRYAQLFPDTKTHSTGCNRGVSGIDGSTSTAVGVADAYRKAPTLLITGDMSATYDIGALFSQLPAARFKMLVVDNGGGGIFRFIKSTSALPDLDECLAMRLSTPFVDVARRLGFACFEVSDIEQLEATLPAFISESSRPAMLVAHTSGELSAVELRRYFKVLQNKETI